MPTNYFYLVQSIVAEKKYFDTSRREIVRQLEGKGEADFETEHLTTDDFLDQQSVILRLNIHCKHPNYVEGWTITLKLHNTRIDGFDWEPKFRGMDGGVHAGWHRHVWDHRLESAERGKVPVSDFGNIKSREEFLIRALKLLKVELSSTDHGTDLLPFS
jgi:hypothetical protein